MTFHLPDLTDGYYRGTRFDHSGVFKSIEYDGCNYAEEWFSGEQGTARTTFMGNLRDAENPSSEYDFLLVEKQNGRSVRMTSEKKFTHAVYWSNHRIACIEPYLEFKLETGDSYSFDIDYTLQ